MLWRPSCLRLTGGLVGDEAVKDDLRSILRRIVVCRELSKARTIALANLICFFERSNDSDIAELLANIIADQSESDGMRTAAYFGLFEVVGRPLAQIGPPEQFSFPDHIDWTFVDLYKTGQRLEGRTGIEENK